MAPRIPHPEPGAPDTRGPVRYIWWLVRCQPWRVLRGSVVGTAWMVALSVRPYLVARAIDDGLRRHDRAALLWWVTAIVAAGVGLAYLGIMRHRTMTFVREDASARSAAVLLRHLARLGAVLPRKLAAGEVATVGGADIAHTSQVLTMTGPGVGAVVAYGVVAVLLWSVSPLLALCVLLGVPAVMVTIAPLLRRLERAQSVYRHQQGLLTTRAGDIVAGLRVLAGVGGRRLFARRYAARGHRPGGTGRSSAGRGHRRPGPGHRPGRPARPVRPERGDLGRGTAGRGRPGRGTRPDPGRRPRLVRLRRDPARDPGDPPGDRGR